MANSSDQCLALLESILTEIKGEAKEPAMVWKLEKAEELIKTMKLRSSGILNKFSLDGQVALVTGGGQGIGKAFAHALGEAGCKVVIADVDLLRAESAVAELRAKSIPCLALEVDVSNKSQVDTMIQSILAHFGDLHIACNNAGIAGQCDSLSTSEEEWNKTMGVNLNGIFFCCQAEGKHMMAKGYGRIINTASILGSVASRPNNQIAPNTAKAAVVHMTKTLAAEWAHGGVTVNCISPGYVDTPLIKSDRLKEARAMWIRDTPMQRFADVNDLTGAVIYLSSPSSSYTTGLDLKIDGGYTCW